MLNKKFLLLSMIICLTGFSMCESKLALSDLSVPKNPAYRVGISDIPENQYVETKQDKANIIEQNIQKQIKANNTNDNDVSYSELSIKRLAKEVAADLEFEEQNMVADLSLLWQGAAMQSDTINFALYKLANPDKDKPNKSAVKKVLQTVASMSTLAGASMGNPLLAGTSLIGGNVLGIMSQDTKALNYKYTKVTDADMIILIRKVEDLQQNAVNLYYDYMAAKKQLEMTTKIAQERKEKFELAQKNNAPKEIVFVTDAYFRTALDRQKTARSEFLSKRAALKQFVGNETFMQFEQELAQRENKNTADNSEYAKTVENVENYTNNLENKTASTENVPYYNASPDIPQLRTTTDDNDENIENNPFAQMAIADAKTGNNEIESTKPSKKTKADRYSTKGLIFLHNTDKQNADNKNINPAKEEATASEKPKKEKKAKKSNKNKKQEIQVKEEKPSQDLIPQQIETPKPTTKFNGVELLPLDEIRTPELTPHGYSIFQ